MRIIATDSLLRSAGRASPVGARLPAIVLVAALAIGGCGARQGGAAPKTAAAPPDTELSAQRQSALSAAPEASPAAGVVVTTSARSDDESAPAPPSPPAGSPGSTPPPAPAEPVAASDRAELARAHRMLDIQANLRVEVKDVRTAADALRRIVQGVHGQITNESLAEEEQAAPHADFTLRVPAPAAFDLLNSLEALGATRSRQVLARDIGKQYYDSVIRLRNLEVTRERLEQILQQAHSVDEVLRVETELTRVRGEIEQIKGEIRYLQDLAALATVHVSLFTHDQKPAEVVNPQAQFFPGLRAAYWHDVQGDGAARGYYGGALTLGFSRRVTISVQGLRRLHHTNGSLDAFAATLGGRFYSQYLGGASRRWASPYLGLAAGYARFEGRDEVLMGGTLGIDIFKNEIVRIDAAVDASALFGTKAGPHLGIVPNLGVDFAF